MDRIPKWCVLLALLVLTGCGSDEPLPASFVPPGVESLADIDRKNTAYEQQTVVIQGVVSPDSQSGMPRKNAGYEVHYFTLSAWRRPGEPVVERDLTVLRAVPVGADYWDDFKEYTIHSMSVLLSKDGTRAVFEKALPLESPDKELLAIAEKLRKPVVVSTKRFGDLVLDRSIGLFEGVAQWNGQKVTIRFPGTGEEPTEKALKTAETLFADQAGWRQRIENYAVKKLLELKNGTWLDDGEPQLTRSQFVSRMTLTSINILSGGNFEFWYNDGDLFAGHLIMVSGNVSGEMTDAGIHG